MADGERRLTPEGREEMRWVARGMRALDLRLDHVWTSPLVRARQTADAVVKELGLEDRLAEDARIASWFRIGDLQELLSGLPGAARVLLVGHEPDFSGLVAELAGGGSIRMKKASLACIDATAVQPGGGELRWLLEAEHLAALGGRK
jgi:phosphohistidine phosphatase